MRRKNQITELELSEHSLEKELVATRRAFQWEVAVALLSIAFGLFGTFASVLISKPSLPQPDRISVVESLSYFVGGVTVLAAIIVGIASFIRRKNRDVIILKQLLAEIYVSALRKSALNPNFHS